MNDPLSDPCFPLVVLGACRRWSGGSGWRWRREAHEVPPDHELWFVWEGRGLLRSAAGERVLRAGCCAWLRPGASYEAEQRGVEPLGATSVRFRFQNRTLEQAAVLPEFLDIGETGYIDAVTRRLVEIAGEPEERGELRAAGGLLLGGLLSDLAARGAGPEAPPPRPAEAQHREAVRRTVRRIREGFARPLSVAGLAREAGYSPAHFGALFKRLTGETPEAMIGRTRIERARHLLRYSTLTVAEVADEAGYRDIYFFSRQFKRKTFLTPTEYRLGRAALS